MESLRLDVNRATPTVITSVNVGVTTTNKYCVEMRYYTTIRLTLASHDMGEWREKAE